MTNVSSSEIEFDVIEHLDAYAEQGVLSIAILAQPHLSILVGRDGKSKKFGIYTANDIDQMAERLVSIAQENGSIKSHIGSPDWVVNGAVSGYRFQIKNGLFGVSLSFELLSPADDESSASQEQGEMVSAPPVLADDLEEFLAA